MVARIIGLEYPELMGKRSQTYMHPNDDGKLSDENLEIAYRLQLVANEHHEMKSLLKAFIAEIKEITGCSAVGIRILDDEGHIPYQAQVGFSREFYELECNLSIKTDRCMCISVIKGEIDPELPYFTKYGSFFTNSLTCLSACATEAQKKEGGRGVCGSFGYESLFLIPIRIEDHVIGLIHIADNREDLLTPNIIAALEKAVSQLGPAIKRTRAGQEMYDSLLSARLRQAEVSALLKGAKEVLKQQEFEKTSRAIFEYCRNLVGATAGYVALLSAEGRENEIQFRDNGGLPCNIKPSDRQPSSISGLRAEAYSSGNTVYKNDFLSSVLADRLPDGHAPIDNALFSPLMIEGEVKGLLGLANKPGGFVEEDVRPISAFAEMIAIALNNSRLLESLKEREERFRSVAQSAFHGIISVNDEGMIIDWNPAATEIFQYSPAEAAGMPFSMLLPARSRREYENGFFQAAMENVSALIGETIELMGRRKDGAEFPLELSLSNWKQKDRTFFTGFVRDLSERKRNETEIRDLAKFPSENPFPVLRIAKDGALLYANPASDSVLGDWDCEVGQPVPVYWRELCAEILADGCEKRGIELECDGIIFSFTGAPIRENYVNLYATDVTETKRAKELSEALNKIDIGIHSTLDFNQILAGVIVQATEAIGCEASGILVKEDDQWVLRFACGFPQEIIGTCFPHSGPPQKASPSDNFGPIVVSDARQSDLISRYLTKEYGIRAVMVIPLVVRKKVIGQLAFANRSAARVFADVEVDFATRLASSIALGIENARLFANQREIAETLQETLLKIPPKIRGIEFGHIYRSAAAEIAKAGGDFYDLFELEDGKLGILIGDVSGKGLEAASLTSLVKNTIKAYAHQIGTPGVIVGLTNDVVEKATDASIFVSLFFGILDAESGVLSYCSAGHPPAVLKRESDIEVLETKSPVVGVFTDVEYIDSEVVLGEDDILILYTDGATEARRGSRLFGEERLFDLIRNLSEAEVKNVPRRILKELLNFCRSALPDDIALLAISLKKRGSHPDSLL